MRDKYIEIKELMKEFKEKIKEHYKALPYQLLIYFRELETQIDKVLEEKDD